MPERLQRAAHSLKGAVATFAAQKAFEAALEPGTAGARRGHGARLSKAVRRARTRRSNVCESVLETLGAGKERVPASETR